MVGSDGRGLGHDFEGDCSVVTSQRYWSPNCLSYGSVSEYMLRAFLCDAFTVLIQKLDLL